MSVLLTLSKIKVKIVPNEILKNESQNIESQTKFVESVLSEIDTEKVISVQSLALPTMFPQESTTVTFTGQFIVFYKD